jgi:hypothetical protein
MEEYTNALPGGMWALAEDEIEPTPATRSDAIRHACLDRPAEIRLIAEVIALAVEDIEVIEAQRGKAAEISDQLRLNAVSSVIFFMKGVGGAYLKAIGIPEVLPKLQERSIRVLGALGPGWAHMASLKADRAEKRMAEALDIARRPIERMAAPAAARPAMRASLVASLF